MCLVPQKANAAGLLHPIFIFFKGLSAAAYPHYVVLLLELRWNVRRFCIAVCKNNTTIVRACCFTIMLDDKINHRLIAGAAPPGDRYASLPFVQCDGAALDLTVEQEHLN